MNLQLDDQVVFVAGSSRGIGRAIAAALLAEGACVILSGRDEAALQSTRMQLASAANKDRLLAIAGDLTDPKAIDAALSEAVSHFGRLDHLVANLGTGCGTSGWDVADAEWQRLFQMNFFGSVRLTQAALPYLLANAGGGSILLISSIVALEATSAPVAYCAAKAALLNYSKNLARQLGPAKIRVNSIAPGNVLFPGGSWQAKWDASPERVDAMLKAEVPQQRFGTPAQIASLAAYLCSPQAAFCTGACYVMDGGQTRSV